MSGSTQSCVKRNVLTIQRKLKIISKLESGSSQADVAREENLPKTTVASIWQSRKKILEASNNKSHKIKKIRDPVRQDVDKALLEWFKNQRSSNIPITGPLLKTKAEDLARLLNEDHQFKCSTGWLERFKARHNICVGKICGEAADVNKNTVSDWLNNVWPIISKDYAADDIFNADETGLFYKLTPDSTLKFKGEKCVGGKHSKLRYTILVCANMSGTEKRKLLVIGKYENPRCMKNVKNLPVRYKANKRSWMTSIVFEEEIRRWDQHLQRKNRKILLLVDNCAAHPKLQNLTHIRLEFLPPNCTSAIQPMDQGVIKCLKTHYRRHLLLRMINAIDTGEEFVLSLLDSIKLLAQSWEQVTPTTIKNCFRHSGIRMIVNDTFDDEDNLPLAQLIPGEDEDVNIIEDADWEMPLSEWLRRHTNSTNDMGDPDELDKFVSIDDDVITSQPLDDAEIVHNVQSLTASSSSAQNSEPESDTEEREALVPTYTQAVAAIKTVTAYLLSTDQISDDILTASLKLENYMELLKFQKSIKQTKMTDFFHTL